MVSIYLFFFFKMFLNLQRIMRHIGGVYTQFYNRDMSTDGALFRGRYKAVLVDHDAYLLHVGKYIHRNPLEANMVEQLEDYPWSSYPAYIGKTKPVSWLYRDQTYSMLTSSQQKCRSYKRYVEESENDQEIVAYYSKQRVSPILGDEDFAAYAGKANQSKNVEAPKYERRFASPKLQDIVREVAQYYDVTEHQIRASVKGRGKKNWPRSVAMYLGQRVGDYTLTEMAHYFGLNHYGSVASQVRLVKARLAEESMVIKEVNSIIVRFDP